MSLQVWLPLNKNVIENKGLSDVVFTNSNPSGITFVDSGIESCYTRAAKQTSGKIISNSTINLDGDLSMCCWAKVTDTVGNTANGLVSNHSHETCTGFGINVKQISTDDYRISCSTGNGSNRTYDTYYGTTNIKNAWHHLCLTYKKSEHVFKLWVDGICELTQTYTNASKSDYIGVFEWAIDYDYVNYRPAASLSDIRIYDHALSDKEVYELAKGLMFHLKLDNTDLYDCSGYGWSVSKYSSGTLTENADTPRYSKSLTFDQTRIDIPLLIPYNTQEFSVSFWINYKTFEHYGETIYQKDGNLYKGMYIALGGNGSDVWLIRFDTASQGYNSTNLALNTWYHVVCTYKAGITKNVYVNNNKGVCTPDTMVSPINTVNSYICRNMSSDISDFRIYRKALSDEEVSELYKVGCSIDNHGNAHCYELIEDKENYFIALTKNANVTNNIAYTFDCGKTWKYKSISASSPTVRVSQDLKVWTISSFGASGWYSKDCGKTLTQLPLSLDYMTISNSGDVITGCSTYSRKTYRIPYPFDSYEELYTATQDIWTAPAINYDGTLIVGRTNSNKNAWAYNNGTTSVVFSGSTSMGQPDIAATSNIVYIKVDTMLYKSLDRGTTFTMVRNDIDSAISFDDAASSRVSNDGKYFILSAQNGNKVGVFSNYGDDYRIINTGTGRVMASCSASGRYMCYTVGSNIFVSTDYGKSFHQIITPSDLTSSGDLMSVTIEDGEIYEATRGVTLFDNAYFYVPFKDKQTVIDINHEISPSANTGSLTSDGYYTDGIDNSGTYLTYTNTNLMSALYNNLTIFLEVTPYELNRNQYLLSITAPRGTWILNMISLFIYKTKNNKFGMTLYEDLSGSSSWLDDEITNSPVVSYGSNYKICLTYDRINGVLKVFINGIVSTYTNFYTTINPDQLSLGRHNGNTTRFAKTTFKDFAVWDRVLTDEECLKLTLDI